MDPFTAPAEIAAILQLAATAVPPGQGGRSSRSERRDAYLDFQKAAFAVASCVTYMNAMQDAVPKVRDGFGPAAIPMIEPVVGFVVEQGPEQKPVPEAVASVLRGVASAVRGAIRGAAISFTAYWAGHVLLQHAGVPRGVLGARGCWQTSGVLLGGYGLWADPDRERPPRTSSLCSSNWPRRPRPPLGSEAAP